MKKLFVIFALILSLSVCACGEADSDTSGERAGGSDIIYVYNYGVYIDPDCIDMFEEETGITVVYDVFDTNEEMYPVIASGSVRYDVVCPSEYMVEKMIANDLLAEINFDNVPNAEYISDTCRQFMKMYDPEGKYSVPYSWGTVGILYNSRMIEEGAIKGWADLWDPQYYDEIMMMDSLRDAFMAAQKLLGYSCNTVDEAEMRAACDKLIEEKEIVYKYDTDAIRDFLLNESAAMGVIYSGEALYCQEDDPDLLYVLPEEGSNVWFDNWVIPANCQNKEGAEAWINFMCRPDIAMMTYEYIHYSTPCSAIIDEIAETYPEDLENPALFPDEETLAKCEIYHYLGEEADELYNELWKEFKTS